MQGFLLHMINGRTFLGILNLVERAFKNFPVRSVYSSRMRYTNNRLVVEAGDGPLPHEVELPVENGPVWK